MKLDTLKSEIFNDAELPLIIQGIRVDPSE